MTASGKRALWAAALTLLSAPAWAETEAPTDHVPDPVVVIQSTTSTQNSGLYDHLLPLAEAATGLEIRVVAVGTGQALQNAARCDGDMVIVHARAAEEAFVTAGFGGPRRDLMANSFVLIGPAEDPAGIADADSARAAFATIAERQARFVSRGDDSGTHARELSLWPDGFDPEESSGTWYRETGAGMGATLNIAVGMSAYTLSDAASWSQFGNRGTHAVLLQGDPALINPYSVIPVSAARCPRINAQGAAALIAWLTGAGGQAAIAAFAPGGTALFEPTAR
ncbi:MAG: substrate-binding domain-containing protein [Pseudomonadota bacterium]